MGSISIRYEFQMPDQSTRPFEVKLDDQSISYLRQTNETPPAWAKLEVGQCTDCPLKIEQHPYCPIAVNLAELIAAFKDEVSHTPARLVVTTEERSYFKDTTIQVGLYSIFGVIMATSGCPKMNSLKPMARFHLPFLTTDEMIIRSVSFHLLAQYMQRSVDGKCEVDLKELDQHFAEIQKVNSGMVKRLSAIMKTGDASQNTITTLDCFTKLLGMALQRNLQKFKALFSNTPL